MPNTVLISVKKEPSEIKALARKHPHCVEIAEKKAFTGSEAEYIALITLAGVTVKSISDVIVALINKKRSFSVKIDGETVSPKSDTEISELMKRVFSED